MTDDKVDCEKSFQNHDGAPKTTRGHGIGKGQMYIYTELGTILKQYIIDTITITHFFLIIDTTIITLKKIIVDTITNT